MRDRPSGALPTLDALVDDPGKAASLTPDAARVLFARLLVAQAALTPALLAAPREHPPSSLDRALGIDEVAGMLSMTRDFLYRHWAALGGFKDNDGHVKFALSTVQKHIRTRANRG